MSSEAFPTIAISTADSPSKSRLQTLGGMVPPRRRRKSSGLGGEIRAGDTGVPAIATLDGRPASPDVSQPSPETDRRNPFSKRRKAKTLLQQFKRASFKHTWIIPLLLLTLILSLYAIRPTPENPLHRFIFLSYRIDDPAALARGTPAQYGKGRWDLALVSFYIIVLSFTREFIMQRLLRPLAKRAGLKSRAKQSRFMEQMYTAIYFGVLGPCGLHVMSRTPVWYFNTRGMYEDFPHQTHEASVKFYYLFQASYWAQQAIVLVLGMEKPRKDFRELVGHHIVTLALIALSYRFHFTYMGLAVYITHDISDFFLATSKVMNYIDHPLVGPYFGFFIGTWLYLRHYLNLKIILSLFTEFKVVGPYVLNWETQQYKCELAFWITLSLLSSLQVLNLFWLFYILRIAYRFIVSNVAEDDRSEVDEDELEDEERLGGGSDPQPGGPQVLLNGGPVVGGPSSSSSVNVGTDALTQRQRPQRPS